MPACKRRVYATMCETDDGKRTGKYRQNKYESRPKKGRSKPKAAPKKPVAAKRTPTISKKETVAKKPKLIKADPGMDYDMRADRSLDDMENLENGGWQNDYNLYLQKEHIKQAWMKRQASKRKKYGTAAKKVVTMKMALKDLEDSFYNRYDDLYEGRIEETYDMVDAGDRLIKARPRLVASFNRMRKDFLSSDREVAAFYLALKNSKHRKLLYQLDKKPKKKVKA